MYRIALSVGCLPRLLSSDPSPAFCSAKVSGFRKWQVTAMRLYCMENLITQINKERLVNSDTALMMKELYYYVPCEYWYDKQDRLRTDIEGRNTPMYMCECPTLAACIQWMIQTREYTFQTEQNVAVWHVVVRAGDYVLYDSESNADAFCCLEEALEKAVQECMELLY